MLLLFSGDVDRLRKQIHDSDIEKQALKQRVDQLLRQQQELEQNSTNLQLTVSTTNFMTLHHKAFICLTL